jgi:hypothetical protein
MERLVVATPVELQRIRGEIEALRNSPNLEAAAQAFASALYDRFPKTFLLVRLFANVRFDGLPECDRRLVEDKARAFGEPLPVPVATPVLALLGTRGRHPDWNVRQRSQRFRCLPLLSSRYVASLSMLCLQLEAMGLDLSTLDSWDTNVTDAGHADQWAGWVHVANPAADRDRQGRMAVPAQDFVSTHGVKSVIGSGAGYKHHPTILTLFSFCAEPTDPALGGPIQGLVEAFRTVTEPLVQADSMFGPQP